MRNIQQAAKFEIRNQKLEINHAGNARIRYFEFRISNFEFRGAFRAA